MADQTPSSQIGFGTMEGSDINAVEIQASKLTSKNFCWGPGSATSSNGPPCNAELNACCGAQNAAASEPTSVGLGSIPKSSMPGSWNVSLKLEKSSPGRSKLSCWTSSTKENSRGSSTFALKPVSAPLEASIPRCCGVERKASPLSKLKSKFDSVTAGAEDRPGVPPCVNCLAETETLASGSTASLFILGRFALLRSGRMIGLVVHGMSTDSAGVPVWYSAVVVTRWHWFGVVATDGQNEVDGSPRCAKWLHAWYHWSYHSSKAGKNSQRRTEKPVKKPVTKLQQTEIDCLDGWPNTMQEEVAIAPRCPGVPRLCMKHRWTKFRGGCHLRPKCPHVR